MLHTLLGLLPFLMAPVEIADDLKLTILYDNYVYLEGTEAQWGYSCLIEKDGQTILFDAGTQGDLLLRNVDKIGVDLSEVDAIVLSHIHMDHVGGLRSALERTPKVPIYVPVSFPGSFVDPLTEDGYKVIRVEEPTAVFDWARLTGEMGDEIREHSLVLSGSEGIVVLTGCAHPGIVEIVEKARTISDKPIELTIGGFHLMRHSEEAVSGIVDELKSLGVEKVAPTHCTGDNARAVFKKILGDAYVEAGTGRVFVF